MPTICLLGVPILLLVNGCATQVETGIVKLADSNIEYFSRGKGETIVLLPGGTLTVGYLMSGPDSPGSQSQRICSDEEGCKHFRHKCVDGPTCRLQTLRRS